MNIFASAFLTAFSSFFILLSTQTASAQELGKQIDVYVDSRGPRISVVYAYDADKLFVGMVNLWGPAILPDGTLQTLAWRLFDSKSGTYLNDWVVEIDYTAPSRYPGTLVFNYALKDKTKVLEAIKTFKNLKLVLSLDKDVANSVATYFVDLGSFCDSHPQNFGNATTGGDGCAADGL